MGLRFISTHSTCLPLDHDRKLDRLQLPKYSHVAPTTKDRPLQSKGSRANDPKGTKGKKLSISKQQTIAFLLYESTH